MTFLNAMMLFGAAAAAIPVIIHLFHRQRVSTVDFSSVAFIKQLKLAQSRALKIRQLLVLLVRALIILLVVLAFARPALESRFAAWIGTGVHQQTAVAIVLDNSYSMSAGNADESAFEYARDTALRIVDQLRDGDEAVVVWTAAPPRATPDRPVFSMARVRNALIAAAVSARAGDIGAAVMLAASLLENTASLNRVLYVITDLQATDWESLRDERRIPQIDPDIPVYLVPVSPPPVTNASIDAVTVSSHLIETRQPETIVATVTNRNAAAMEERAVSVYLNDVKRGAQTISAKPGQSQTVRFGVTLNTPGRYAGYIALDHDDLILDNRRYFTWTIPERIHVTVIASQESGYFIEQVLTPASGITTPIQVRRVSASGLNGAELDHTHVVILDGEPSLSPAQLSSLDRFVRAGGGLMVFLGEGVDTAAYNTNLLPEMFACTIQGHAGTPGQRQSYVSFGRVDYGHPLFDVFQRREGPLPDSPRFFASYRLSSDPRARVIARFTDGVPAIVEGRHGRGKALLIASGLNPRWSDLPLKSFFVPLMHRGIRYVHPDFDATGAEAVVGMPVERGVTWSDGDAPIEVVFPSGETERVKPTASNGGMTVTITRTDEPGIYRIQSGARILDAFAVNVDTNESALNRIDAQEAGRLLRHERVRLLEPASSLEQSLQRSQQGYEIWKPLLWLALALIVVESLLTQLPIREGLR